ncbi:hypothetical protein B0T16DRAFT_399066 [Cercophora newfieldiana]|uniref:Tim44-like domain-containing protein n=1 Tax=Cercophora newfieldiana TaxID=92897 RepID=A0AA40D103_9PEZI|nr:hypothetical protein B0T16DRAFT_399066 [Cercophora newfieldiana]
MASTRVGLRAFRDMFSHTVKRATTVPAIRRTVVAPLVARSVRNASTRGFDRKSHLPPSPSARTSSLDQLDRIEPSAMQMILPGTLIPPPLSQWPRQPKPFFNFFWDVVKAWGRGKLQVLMMSISSKKGILKPRQFKLNNAQVILTAKAMHREMAEALAVGNKDALTKLCVKALATPLSANIDSRQNSRRYDWELVKYSGWRNPTIVSQSLSPILQSKGSPLMRQVIVRIKSRQRRTTYHKSANGLWQVNEGGKQEMDLEEYVALVSIVKPTTWASSEWRILGSVEPTTPEEWEMEKNALNAIEQEELKKYKL